jgi:uncharacterized protein (DUF1697 family)
MALVVLLRGVNVGGHKSFRPSALAAELAHLGAVSIGAAGTFVIPGPVTTAQLRAEFARRLPFEAEIMICEGREIVRLVSHHHYGDQPAAAGEVRFVSVLSRRPSSAPPLPMSFPSSGRWLLKVVARDNRFVFGVYRRDPKVIGYLGMVERMFELPATTRNWNTITAIARVLGAVSPRGKRSGTKAPSGRSAHE